jgi:hypothetical protein
LRYLSLLFAVSASLKLAAALNFSACFNLATSLAFSAYEVNGVTVLPVPSSRRLVNAQ